MHSRHSNEGGWKSQAMTLARDTFADFSEDRVMQHAAALAFYTIFSLGPVLIIVLAIAGLVWGQEAARGELVGQFRGIAGEGGAQQIEGVLKNAHQSGGSVFATIIGFVTLILGATGVFAQLKDSLNTIWEVKVKSGRGVWGILRDRLLSFGVVLAIAFLLLATLVASAAISAIGKWMEGVLPAPPIVFQLLDLLVSFGILTLLFAAIFKWLPDVKIGWRNVWFGAIVTAILFGIGKFALGLYLGRSSVASVYGAAGSLIVILLWVYYSSVIFLAGAEFTQVYANWRGARIEPSDIAEWAIVPQSGKADRRAQRASGKCPAAPPRRRALTSRPREQDIGSLVTRLAAASVVELWRARRGAAHHPTDRWRLK